MPLTAWSLGSEQELRNHPVPPGVVAAGIAQPADRSRTLRLRQELL
jgi:hypothetical protein